MLTAATYEDLATRILRLLDVTCDLIERRLATTIYTSIYSEMKQVAKTDVHDGTHEVRKVRGRANLELRDLI